MPDGVIKDSSIENATALTKAIKQLTTRNKIRASQAAMSLVVKPVFVQIMDMPKQVPTNTGGKKFCEVNNNHLACRGSMMVCSVM